MIVGHHKAMINLRDRSKASGIHLVISLAIAALAAALVFGIWFPYPYREISGGRDLFILVVAVDVVMGPLITLAVFSRAKPWAELRRDLAVVGLLQLLALGYGLWTVALARPVHLVYEIDRFRVVHAVDVPEELLARTPSGITAFPWLGPTPLAIRPFRTQAENLDATMAALGGVALGARPDFWRPYQDARADILRDAKPVAMLRTRFPQSAGPIDHVLRDAGRDPSTTAWMPVVGRNQAWTVFLDASTADVVAFMPLDSL